MWSEGAIANEHVTSFEVHDGVLYAGTRSDLFRLPLNAPTDWEPLRLAEIIDGRGIRGFAVLNSSTILAGVGSFDEYRHNTTPLYRTTDGGESWHPFQNEFGDEEGDYNALTSLDITRESNIIFADAGGIARSDNAGQSWELVWGSWDGASWPGFLHIDQQNPETVWSGNADPTFRPWLLKTEDGGENWDRFRPLQDAEGLPSDILIHPEDSDHVLVTITGGYRWGVPLRVTTDGGATWDTLFPDGPNLHAITGSPRHSNIAYTSGQNENGTLFFARTTDFGASWEIVEHEEGPRDIQVEEMVATVHEGQEILFLGTNKGVYSYTFEE